MKKGDVKSGDPQKEALKGEMVTESVVDKCRNPSNACHWQAFFCAAKGGATASWI
jgi:hypothetical protein